MGINSSFANEVNKQLTMRTNAHPNRFKMKEDLPYQGKVISNWILLFGVLLSISDLPAIFFGLYFSESKIYHNREKVKKYHKNSRKYAEIISSLGFIVLLFQILYWLKH